MDEMSVPSHQLPLEHRTLVKVKTLGGRRQKP